MLNKSKIKSIRNYFLLSFITLWLSFCNINTPFSRKESSNDNNLLLGVVLYTALANNGNCETGGDIWARNIQTQNSYCVPVELVASYAKVDVYKQRGLSVNYNLQTFGKEFNDTTYPKLISTFGEPSDVDKNGKIKILVLDIRDGATANSSYVAGFFDPVNYFADQPGTNLRSNYSEILYMDGKELIDALVRDPTAFSSTAAHEFQHLIRYPYMVATRATDDSWINEGTSEVASDIAGYGPQKYRIDCFRGADSTRCPNGVNGVSFLNWSAGTTSSVILKQYAFAYAFMRYLYDISGNTEAEKNEFFRKSVQGNSIGIRAGSASQLMSVFRESARFNTTLLGSLNSDTFFRTFTLFMGQSAGTLNFAGVERFDASTNVEALDLSTAYAAYPFESTLNDIVAGPLGVNTATGTLSFAQGSGYAFTGNYNLASYSSTRYPNMTTVKSAGNTKSVLAWAAYSTNVNASVKNGITTTSTKSEEAENRYKSVILGDTITEGPLPVCGTQFINDEPHIYESIPLEQPSSKNGNTP
ncbi:peptidase MA family protein [Leptospira kobayashii]|uniref:peptidase MA family protein n=1 Tax=Leptospira kobayashii TaxID=1917830 RepID=UPI001FA7CF62|nr:peptidase MA family protein [Leptospira kobayashii]